MPSDQILLVIFIIIGMIIPSSILFSDDSRFHNK